MRKFTLLVGAGVGFLAGSRAGRGPYNSVKTQFNKVARRPPVHDAISGLKATAADRAGAMTDKIADKLPTPDNGSTADATSEDPSAPIIHVSEPSELSGPDAPFTEVP